jgi:tRNA(adenine34) deaminase
VKDRFFPRDDYFMRMALREAELAPAHEDVPIGAVIVRGGEVIAAARNERELRGDPTAHAEIIALREAARVVGSWRVLDAAVYVTLEPCAMCAAAISFARIRRLYFGAYDPKGGAVEHGPRFFELATCHHRPEIYGGIEEVRAAALLKRFFAEKR